MMEFVFKSTFNRGNVEEDWLSSMRTQFIWTFEHGDTSMYPRLTPYHTKFNHSYKNNDSICCWWFLVSLNFFNVFSGVPLPTFPAFFQPPNRNFYIYFI